MSLFFVFDLPITCRGFVSFAIPANCTLSGKVKYLFEERNTIQEKPAIVRNRWWQKLLSA